MQLFTNMPRCEKMCKSKGQTHKLCVCLRYNNQLLPVGAPGYKGNSKYPEQTSSV